MTKEEALNLALDALETSMYPQQKQLQAITAIKEALAQPEQEPVVWMYQDKSTHDVRFQKHMRGFVDHGATYETPLYTSPPQQELVCVCGAVWEGQELIYTTPQRTWVGLTDEEIVLIVAECAASHQHTDIHFARAIEAKLKEKNT
jgi:hypothetical protein